MAAAKSAFSSLHYYCPLLHTVYALHTVQGERGRHRRRRRQRLFGATRSAALLPPVRPSISFPLLHRLIRPIFLPLTMGSLSALPAARRERERGVGVCRPLKGLLTSRMNGYSTSSRTRPRPHTVTGSECDRRMNDATKIRSHPLQ